MSKIKPQHVQWILLDDSPQDLLNLSKYSPKYYNKLESTLSTLCSSKVRNKIKNIKLIRTINIKDHFLKGSAKKLGYLRCFSSSVKNAYIRDPKTLMMFPKLQKITLDVYRLDCWKLFERSVNLTELSVEFANYSSLKGADPQSPKVDKYLSYRFWKHINRLSGLKTLHIQISNDFNAVTYKFLGKLNKSSKILKKLTELTLFLNHANIQESQVFPSLDCLFQNTTCIQLHELNCVILQHVLQSLDQFTNLSYFKLIQNLQIPYAAEYNKLNL